MENFKPNNYLLIEDIIYLDRKDEFSIMSALLYMLTYWIRPIVDYDLTLSIVMIHQTTIPHKLSNQLKALTYM